MMRSCAAVALRIAVCAFTCVVATLVLVLAQEFLQFKILWGTQGFLIAAATFAMWFWGPKFEAITNKATTRQVP